MNRTEAVVEVQKKMAEWDSGPFPPTMADAEELLEEHMGSDMGDRLDYGRVVAEIADKIAADAERRADRDAA